MRIKIVFDHLPNVKLPMNYQHIISAWIYDTLYKSDPEFGDWLHEQGFEYKGKRYKHFCFSFLSPARYRIEGRDFLLAEAPTELILSFQIEEGGKKWISQIFKDALFRIQSGPYQSVLQIRELSILPEPVFRETMVFRTRTPIAISIGREGWALPEFIAPDHERYEEVFNQNLVHKANAFLREEKYRSEEVSLSIRSEEVSLSIRSDSARLKGLGVGKSKVKGYMYDFELNGPPELLRIGYYAGFGIQNARLGMGFCTIMDDE